jgi:hypothetical protein
MVINFCFARPNCVTMPLVDAAKSRTDEVVLLFERALEGTGTEVDQ